MALASLVSAAGPAAAAPGDTIIYGANAYGLNDIYELNLSQGTATYQGDTARSSQAIDQDPVTGLVWYYEWRASGNELGYWDPETGANVIAHVFSPSPGVYAKRLAFDNEGVMWMMDSAERLWEIDHISGSMSFRGNVPGITGGPYGATGDMAFAPDGTLYVATYRELYTVDIDTLTATLLYTDMIDVPVPGVLLWTGLAFCDGLLYASNGEETTSRSGMFEIDPATGDETFLYYLPNFVNDLTSCSAMSTASNTAPVADDVSVSTPFETAVGVTLTASDADGDPLTYQVVSGPTDGTLSGTAPNLTYTPDAGHEGVDSFTFTASDGTATSNTATVTVTTGPAADTVPAAPTATSATAADGSVNLSWSAPADDGGTPVTDYVIESAPVGGNWTTVADGVSAATSAVVSGLTNYDQYEFRVAAVNAVGNGPTGDIASATPTDGNDPNDTFNRPDGPLSNSADWTPVGLGYSDLLLDDGHVVGTSDPDGSGTAYNIPVGPSVEVTVDTLLGDDYSEASVILRLNSTTDITESYLLQWVTDGDFAANGTIPGPTLQIWRIDAGPAFVLLAEAALPDNGERTLTFGASGSDLYISENGTVLLSATDSTYPAGDFILLGQSNISSGGAPSQLDNFRYQVLDTPNRAPVASDAPVTTSFESAVGVTLTASDADGDPLTYQVVSGPTDGTLSGTAPNLTYTPDGGFSGVDSFTFTASDGTETSNTATVTVTTDPAPSSARMYGGNRGRLNLEIDPAGPTTTVAPGLTVGTHAMASDPATGDIYYIEWSTSGDEFVRFDPDAGTHTTIRTYSPAPGFYFTGMVMAPSGILHAIDSTGGFHEIDPASGDITTLGTISGMTSGIYGQTGDLEYDDAGTLYFASYGELYEIDVATLSATTLYSGMIPGGGFRIWTGLSYCDGELWAVDIDSATILSRLYTIDVATGAVTTELSLTTYLTDLTTCTG